MAFLHLVSKSSVNLVSKQLVSQLNFKDIKATMVLCSKFDLWSVCIFLNTEKPRSESAFEHGMHNRPTISWYNFGNLWLPSAVSNFPTSHQNDPARGFVVPSAAWYVLAAGRSCGESEIKKLFSQSLQRLRISDVQLWEAFGQVENRGNWVRKGFLWL